MLNSRVREHVQTSLQGIAKRAKESKKYRFYDLARMINRISLMDAWLDINRSAASGVDKITTKEYENINKYINEKKNICKYKKKNSK